MSTKSFTINLPIITGDQDRRRLQKSFSFGCNLQNAVMGGGWDRVLTYAPERICEAVLQLLHLLLLRELQPLFQFRK